MKLIKSSHEQGYSICSHKILEHDDSDEFVAVALSLVAGENEDSFQTVAANV